MMRLQTYAGVSLIATLSIIYHAFNTRGQFYPAMVYLSTSKISLALLLNMSLAGMCTLWKLTKTIFLGSLREAEVERLNEQLWREIMDVLFAVTIFRADFTVVFLARVAGLMFVKAMHWLAQKRVEFIETTPSVPMLAHVRIVSFMGFLLLVDGVFCYSNVRFLVETRQASVSLFFSFEYMILATATISMFVKYVFYVSDMLMDGQWEKKAVYTFYLELIRDLLHLSMYLCFFLAIFMSYGVPLHLIRELYETFRNIKIRISDYIRYWKITSNMNDRFPDATPEELNTSDVTCIICREEMTEAKKLLCGHLFHVHCLRSWLERQQTCPTCRALVVPPEDGTTATGRQQSRTGVRQQGTGTSSASAPNSAGRDVGTDNLSRHQARLQAAAAAASIYGKSFVYPSASTHAWSPGYAVVPNVNRPMNDASSSVSGKEPVPNQHPQFVIPGGPANMFSPNVLASFQAVNTTATHGEVSQNDPNLPAFQVEAQKKSLQYQIEVLQSQLKTLQETKVGESKDAGLSSTSASKGKNIAASTTSSVSDCGGHRDPEE